MKISLLLISGCCLCLLKSQMLEAASLLQAACEQGVTYLDHGKCVTCKRQCDDQYGGPSSPGCRERCPGYQPPSVGLFDKRWLILIVAGSILAIGCAIGFLEKRFKVISNLRNRCTHISVPVTDPQPEPRDQPADQDAEGANSLLRRDGAQDGEDLGETVRTSQEETHPIEILVDPQDTMESEGAGKLRVVTSVIVPVDHPQEITENILNDAVV